MRHPSDCEKQAAMSESMKKVEILRWDDDRCYHQCRINQSLHLISAISFLVAYALLFICLLYTSRCV